MKETVPVTENRAPFEESVVIMHEPSRYWNLIRLDATEMGRGYKLQRLPPAQEFLGQHFPECLDSVVGLDDGIPVQLLRWYRDLTPDPESRSGAELCLRCYVSYPILQSCLKRSRLFGPGNGFTYRDLLPFVLNDSGDRPQGGFVPFSIEILQSFSPDQNCTLTGWVDLRVRRNPELNRFLLERGLHFSSDWALLNRANPRELADMDAALVEVFHEVYRRDRLQQQRPGRRQKCLDPTAAQLQEMMQRLRAQQVLLHSSHSLLSQLKRIAQTLRQEDIWGRRGFPLTEPLETADPETGEIHLREIPSYSVSHAEAIQHSELQQFCDERLLHSLDQGIRQTICDRIQHLEQRPRYAPLAHQVKPALCLLYFEGKSQAQIATLLGMTNQSQVSRILNPKELLSSIRQRTLEILLHDILTKVRELEIVEFPVSPEYFTNLMQQLEAFVDEQVFQAAAAEINTGRNRVMESLLAQRLRHILSEPTLRLSNCLI